MCVMRSKLLLVALASIISVAFTAECAQPIQLHTALAGTGNRLNVAWTTVQNNADAYVPTLVWGTDPKYLVNVVSGLDGGCSTRSYVPGTYHHDCTSGVLESTTYYYAVGDSKCTQSFSDVTKFMPQPIGGGDVAVAFVGDMGVDNMAGTLASLSNDIKDKRISMVVHLGDIAYADDIEESERDKVTYEDVMNNFFNLIEPVAKTVPYHVTPGNHDVTCRIFGDTGCPDNLKNFTSYNSRWRMLGYDAPQADAVRANGNMWYAYTYGNIRFISINTESDYPNAPYTPDGAETKAGGFTGDQIAWLENELLKAASTRDFDHPWIVVYGHRPLYSTSRIDYPPDQENRTRAVLEPLFQKYGVDMYISGHVHLFERTLPMANGKPTASRYVNPSSPVYVINGAAGNVEGHFTNVTNLPPYVAARNMRDYGYGILRSTTNPNIRVGPRFTLCHYFIAGFGSETNPKDLFCIQKDKF